MNERSQIESLIFVSRNGSAEERSAAIADLEELGAREAVPALLELLDYPHAGVRANVAQTLGQLGNESVGPALVALLADADSLVRMKAAESLGDLRYEDGVDALLRALTRERDPLVTIHLVEALGHLKDLRALPSLMMALDHPDEHVRAYAADAIGRLGSNKVLSALSARTASERSAFAKAYLLAACYRLGDDRSLTALIELSETSDDVLAVTIWNLAAESATSKDAARLKSLLGPVARSRPSLSMEVDSLMARLDALERDGP